MKKYKAVANGKSIVTVIATDKMAAREKIERQLEKPGRYTYLKLWQDTGEKIEEIS